MGLRFKFPFSLLRFVCTSGLQFALTIKSQHDGLQVTLGALKDNVRLTPEMLARVNNVCRHG